MAVIVLAENSRTSGEEFKEFYCGTCSRKEITIRW